MYLQLFRMGCLLSFVIPCNAVMNNHVRILFILHGYIFKGRSRSRSQNVDARGKLLGHFVRCWQILPLRGCHCATTARNVRMDPSWLVNVLDTMPSSHILCPSGHCLSFWALLPLTTPSPVSSHSRRLIPRCPTATEPCTNQNSLSYPLNCSLDGMTIQVDTKLGTR